MQGTNTFRFNQATIVEALQYYLDRQLTVAGAVIVKSVTYETNTGTCSVVVETPEKK